MVQNLEYSAITISSYFDQSIGQSIKTQWVWEKGYRDGCFGQSQDLAEE